MRTQEEIETLANIVGDYFDYPGVKDTTDEDIIATKYDMAIIEDVLQWVLGCGTPGMERLANGLIDIAKRHPEITRVE